MRFEVSRDERNGLSAIILNQFNRPSG